MEESKGVKRGYSLKSPVPVSVRCDSIETKRILFNEPGVHVAATGGIPDELKINGGLSFLQPSPIFKYPKEYPEDPTEHDKALDEIFEEGMQTDAYINAFVEAYLKAKSQPRVGSICKQEEEAHK